MIEKKVAVAKTFATATDDLCLLFYSFENIKRSIQKNVFIIAFYTIALQIEGKYPRLLFVLYRFFRLSFHNP